MNIEAFKISLLKKVLEEKNESILKKINRLLNKDAKIVAYSASGEPLTKLDYLKEIEIGVNDIADGKVLSSKELRNKIDSWTKS